MSWNVYYRFAQRKRYGLGPEEMPEQASSLVDTHPIVYSIVKRKEEANSTLIAD